MGKEERKQKAERYKKDLNNDPMLKKAYKKLKPHANPPITHVAVTTQREDGTETKRYALDPQEIDLALREAWEKVYDGATKRQHKLANKLCKKYNWLSQRTRTRMNRLIRTCWKNI